MRVGVFNEDGEPLGFEDVYEADPNDDADWYDEYPYRPSIDDDRQGHRENGDWYDDEYEDD